MAGIAVPRSQVDPNNPYSGIRSTITDWMTKETQDNPNYKVAPGYHLEDGQVVKDQPSFLLRHPWLFPAAGVGAGLGLAAAGVGAGASGASGLSAGSSGVASGLPGEMATLPGAGGTGAASLTGATAAMPTSEAEALASGYGSIAGPSASDVVGGLTPSLSSRILGGLKDLSPILSGAAKNEADANRFSDTFNLRAADENATLPGERYRSALSAALPGMTTPYSIKFGGPGSGLRNQAPTISGGIDWSKMPSDVSQLRDQVIHDMLLQQLAGPIKQRPTSAGDKALGIGATIAGIGGALSRFL